MCTINMIMHISSIHLSYGSYKAIISLQKCQTRWQGPKMIDFIQQRTWKIYILETFSEELFRAHSDGISHRIFIDRTSCCQLPARSMIFCLLAKVFYWPCCLQSVYQKKNVPFSGNNSSVKLPVKFYFEWFCIQIIRDAKYFSSLV